MAVIIRDPLVADHIVEMGVDSEEERSQARQRYEEGNLVLLKGVRFDLDFDFLDSLDFNVAGPPEIMRKVKKFGGNKILALDPKNLGPVDGFVFREILGSDEGKLRYFQEQVRSGGAQADDLYAKLFPNYINTRSVYTWRFTATMFENLHWDNFGIPEPFHQVRIFSNIAKSPRLWRTSHRIDEFAAASYRQHKLERFRGRIGDDLNFYVNNDVLGGMLTPCLDRLPKNHIAFEQGEVWLCETRIVSHQIYHGEKAFATMYFSEPASMDNPQLGFEERIARLHEQQALGGTAGSPAAAN